MKEKRRMISEAAKELGLETYTLRAWEEELKLNIPRNDKGYRYYGEKELHTFIKIRDMRDEGMSMDEIKEALPKNVIPFPAGGWVRRIKWNSSKMLWLRLWDGP